MAKRQNYGFEKRQKDLKKQQKRDEKAEKKRLREQLTDPSAPLDEGTEEAVRALCTEGWELFETFSAKAGTGTGEFHPFIAADYETVLAALLPRRGAGLKFLEWGSATGVITIMADLLGFEAFGIEIDIDLVHIARDLAERHYSEARFAAGSFLPAGYEWRPTSGDGRTATIATGTSGYLELATPLDEFDVVFGFPWPGEEPMMLDLMRAYGRPDAYLLLNTVNDGVQTYQGGRLLPA
ncbi:MAG: hypothetical protein ABIZ70_03400 [Gemmatimonadales bacterium]